MHFKRLLVLACLTGCPDPTQPPEPVLTPLQVFVRSCDSYAQAWCDRRDWCAVSNDRAQQGAACLEAAKAGCRAVEQVALMRPFEDFDTAQASACTSAVASAECAIMDEWVVDLTVCREAFGARAATSGACLVNGDCLGGYCARDRDGCGQCEPRSAIAESCAEFPCVEGAVCVRDVCRPRRSAGEACEQDVECGPALFCHLERRVCEAQRGVNAPCADDRGIRDCAENLYCADRVCTAKIERLTGSPCVQEGSACLEGNWCDGEFCRRYLETGAACSEDFSCGPLGACVELSCAVRGEAGATCSRDRHCLMGLACFDGQCSNAEGCP